MVIDMNPQQDKKKLDLNTIGWYATFALTPFGTCVLGLLILLIAKIKRLFQRNRSQNINLNCSPLVKATYIFFLALITVMLFSILFSTRKDIAFLSSLGFFLMSYAFIIGGYEFSSSGELIRKKYFLALIASSILATSVAIIRFFGGHFDRAINLFTSFNGFGTTLIMITGLTIGYLFWRGGRWRYLLFPFLGLVFPTLILTQSRGGWAGFSAMLFSFSLFNRKILIIFLIIVLVSGIIFLASPPLKDRFLSAFLVEKNQNRIYIWQSTLRIIKDHPVFGVGAGVYPFIYDKYAMPGSTERRVSFAHNLFLHITAEFGFLGLFIFCLIIFSVLFMSLKLASLGNSLYQGIFGTLVGVLVHQQVDIPIWGVDIGGTFWAIVGIIIGLYQFEWVRGKFSKTSTPFTP